MTISADNAKMLVNCDMSDVGQIYCLLAAEDTLWRGCQNRIIYSLKIWTLMSLVTSSVEFRRQGFSIS